MRFINGPNQTCGAIKEIKITKKENKVLENFQKSRYFWTIKKNNGNN